MTTQYIPPTEDQKKERRKAATHIRHDTLFQLSKDGDDFYPQVMWFNEASGKWQWHDLTNDEVKYGKEFSLANVIAQMPLRANTTNTNKL